MVKKPKVESRAIVYERFGEADHVAVAIFRGRLNDGRTRFAVMAEYDHAVYRSDGRPLTVCIEAVFDDYESALASVPGAVEMIIEAVEAAAVGCVDIGRYELKSFTDNPGGAAAG